MEYEEGIGVYRLLLVISPWQYYTFLILKQPKVNESR